MRDENRYLCAVCGGLHPVGFSHDEWMEELGEPYWNDEVEKDLIEIQKQKQFEKKLQERVNREDLIKWASSSDYVDNIKEKLVKGTEEETEFRLDLLFAGLLLIICILAYLFIFRYNHKTHQEKSIIEQVISLKDGKEVR